MVAQGLWLGRLPALAPCLIVRVSPLWDAEADAGPSDLPARVGLVLDRLVPAGLPLLFHADRREYRLQELLDVVRARYAALAVDGRLRLEQFAFARRLVGVLGGADFARRDADAGCLNSLFCQY